MPTFQNITDADTFDATVQTLNDGYPVNGVNLKQPGQNLANRSRFL